MTDVGALAGQVALVTGGTRGLGRGIAARLAVEGADVAIVGRDGARAVMLQLRLPRSVLLKRVLFFPTSEWH